MQITGPLHKHKISRLVVTPTILLYEQFYYFYTVICNLICNINCIKCLVSLLFQNNCSESLWSREIRLFYNVPFTRNPRRKIQVQASSMINDDIRITFSSFFPLNRKIAVISFDYTQVVANIAEEHYLWIITLALVRPRWLSKWLKTTGKSMHHRCGTCWAKSYRTFFMLVSKMSNSLSAISRDLSRTKTCLPDEAVRNTHFGRANNLILS